MRPEDYFRKEKAIMSDKQDVECIQIRMVDSDKARAVLEEKVRQVRGLACDFSSVRPPSEQDRFYLLRELRKSLKDLNDFRCVITSEQQET